MKSHEIAEMFRRKIVSGELKPGAALPKREQLLKLCDASKGTVQTAVNKLMEDGFLESHGVKGTFVSKAPPHLGRVGIAFPSLEGQDERPDSFWTMLERQAREIERQSEEVAFEAYREIGMRGSSRELERLLSDIEARKMLGLVLVEYWRLPGMILKEIFSKVPTLVFSVEPIAERNVHRIYLDYTSVIDEGLDALKRLGARDVAMVTNAELPEDFVAHYVRAAREKGLRAPEEWMQACPLGLREALWTSNMAKLLFSPEMRRRPEGLLILNDNLAPHVFRTLSSLGLTPGKDVQVASLTNAPGSRTIPPGVKRLCFDTRRVFERAFEFFRRRESARPVDGVSVVKALCDSKSHAAI